jgi:lambda repressor-like predicted transcriptional regulator
MRYHRARTNLDRHPNYILAAYMSSGTSTALFCRRRDVANCPDARKIQHAGWSVASKPKRANANEH